MAEQLLVFQKSSNDPNYKVCALRLKNKLKCYNFRTKVLLSLEWPKYQGNTNIPLGYAKLPLNLT